MGKRGVFAVVALIVLLSISFSLVAFAQSEESSVEIDPFVESVLTVAPEVNVIVVLKDTEVSITKDAPREEILEKTKEAVEEVKTEFLDNISTPEEGFETSSESNPVVVTKTYETINAVAATVTQEGLEELKNNPAVEQVILEPIFHTSMIDTVPLLNADDVHNLSIAGTKLNGTGMIACVLDSGIELNHSAFTGRILQGYDFINNDSSPDDDMANSHGTHVSGTIAGLTPNGTGIAPGAQIVPIKVCNASGSCSGSAILSGIDFCNNLTLTYNISVLSMSISDGGQYDSGTCPSYFDGAFSTTTAIGIIPVTASGNNGFTGGISYPACSPYTVSVGSTTKADAMSTFTNRGGDTLDILAPGSSIISTIRGNTVGPLTGTSMATPHVSGLVLLMQQNELLNNRSKLSISQIRSVLQQTGVPVSGYQRIDAYNAITKLNYNYTINKSANKVSYQSGSESSSVAFGTATDFSGFAECAALDSNFVYINSASCSQFNKSASIEFGGIAASNVTPTKDGASCGSDCTNVNFAGGVLTFDVSSFSNYSYQISSNSSGSNQSILNITSHYTLTGDYNGSIHLLADNIIFDCAGYSINAGSEPAIRADSRTNVTIKNCSISGTTDILFNGTSESMVAATQGNGSLIFMNSDDNTLEDLTLRSSGLWISTDSLSTGNEFINLTFANGWTSITYENVTAPAGTNVNQTNFALNSGSVKVNGSQLSWLNTEATIVMENLASAGASSAFSPPAAFTQTPIIDLNDNGNFVPCPPSICNQTDYHTDKLIFTTQHFTTINSSSSFPVLINDSSTLTTNISVNTSAVIFNNNSISLDCQGFTIFYAQNSSGDAISSTNKFNISVENCNTVQNTSEDNSRGINFQGTNSSIIRNFNATTTTVGGNSQGIIIAAPSGESSQNNTVINSRTSTNNSAGISIINQINTSLYNLNLTSNTSAFIIVTSNNTLLFNVSVNSSTNGIESTGTNNKFHNVVSSAGGFHALSISGCSYCEIINSTLINRVTNIAGFFPNNALTNFDSNVTIINSKLIAETIGGVGVYTSPFGAASIINASNLTIESADAWIRVGSGGFINGTIIFNNSNGSINYYAGVNVTSLIINQSGLSIINNKAFVNVSEHSSLNRTAQITLMNATASSIQGFSPSTRQITVDTSDTGNFVPCDPSVCTVISYNGSKLIFNVTHFTSYSSNDSFPAIINVSSNLTSNITVNGTAFIINASNIVFDCNGFTITGNGSGTGIDVTSKLNVTIQNCNIVNFNRNILFLNTNYSKILNTSTSNSSQENIELSTSHNNTLNNITAQGNSTSFPTINLTRGLSNNLTNIYSSSVDNSGAGAIALDTQSEHNILTNITVTGANSAIGILIHEQSNNNTLTNITATTNSNAAIYIENSNLTSVIGGNLTSNSQPGLYLSISQNITLANLEIISSSGLGADVANVQNSSFTNINFTSTGNEALRLNGAVNQNNFINIKSSSTSNPAIRVTGSDNSFTNTTASSSSSVALLVISNSMRNNFTNTQATSSSGLGLSVSLNSNNNTFENSIFASNTLRSISLVSGVQNNTFRNITIFSNATWIHADGDSPNNSFTNTTFESNSGSIRAFAFSMGNGSAAGVNNLSITQNKAFLNSSLLPFLNVSSQITLHNVSSAVPYVDFNDDGIFEVCNPPQCIVQNFNGSTIIFNVSSFTSYSTSSSGNVTVTLSKTDSADPVGPGDIFTYRINYSVTNGTSFNTIIQENYPSQLVFINATPAPNASNNIWLAGNLSENSTFQINITVQANSSVLSTTTVNNTVNVSYENSTGSQFNINVTQNTTILIAFPVNISTNTTLITNITTNGSAFVMNTSNVTFNCNGNAVIGPGFGVAFNITNANGVSIINCHIQNFTSDILLFNSIFANLSNNTLVTPTTWLSADATSNASLSDITFQNGQGSLLLLTQVIMPSSSNVNNVKLNIPLNKAFLNSSNLTFLNTSFRVRLDNLNVAAPDILADYDDDNIFQLCSVCSFVSYNGSTLIFDVAHFTTYTSVESGVNFTITKTASPNPVTPGNPVTYTITITVNSGFASNITVVENPPAELSFVTSTPTNVSDNTWLLQNLSTGQSAQINVTYNVNASFTGTINNTINVSFQNSTNGTITTQINSTSTASFPAPSQTSGGGGGGGGGASICPPLCSNPDNWNLAICRNNCPPRQQPSTQPVTFPEFPTNNNAAKESSSSELVQPKEEAAQQVAQAPAETSKEEATSEEDKERLAVLSSPFVKFGLPIILGIIILIIILSRLPRHPKDKVSMDLKKNEERIKEIERQLRR